MHLILIIGLLFGLIFLVGVIIKYFLSKKLLLDTFNSGNVITFGKQGKGKDILTQFVIKHNKDKTYFGNLSYGYGYNHIELKDLELGTNTYENFINGNVIKIDKKEELEGHNIYFSDAGIYLPSQYDHMLHKKYPSLPIFYALTRQLYNGHFHMNTQSLERPWKAVREQGETYVKLVRTRNFILFLYTKFYIYDKYKTALADIEPFKPHKHGLFKDKENTDLEKAKFKSMYGEIKQGFIIQLKRKIYYDTRYFSKIVFKDTTFNAVTSREKWGRLKSIINRIKERFRKKKEEDK